MPARKRTQIVAIDLGARTIKAVHLQRKDNRFELLQYAVLDAPASEKALTVEALAGHLSSLAQSLGNKAKHIALAIGVNDSLLRPAEIPMMAVSDMRHVLKFNSKAYFQQEFAEHTFDCFILPPPPGKPVTEAFKPGAKCRVLVGGARRQFIETLQAGTKLAGLVPEHVTPGLVGNLNAFELAQADVFAKEVVALVDIGFKNSTISILLNGELALSRVVSLGGDKLTSGLAEALSISYPEAEGIKIGMPGEVQGAMLPLITPLGRELRASIDFFEHQQDRTVSQVFLSGGSARSRFVVEALQTEMMVPCHTWNPAGAMGLSLPPAQIGEIEEVSPQLTVAVGTAIAAFN